MQQPKKFFFNINQSENRNIKQLYNERKMYDSDGVIISIDDMPLMKAIRLNEKVKNKEVMIKKNNKIENNKIENNKIENNKMDNEIDHSINNEENIYLMINAAPVVDSKGNINAAISVFTDITMQKNIENKLRDNEKELEQFASFDGMTGLLNRRTGFKVLEKEFNNARENNTNLTICFLDINGLKYVNDTFGHNDGDWLIKTSAEIMSSSINHFGSVCRLGGDEFLIIIPGYTVETSNIFWDKITQSQVEINMANQKPYKISLSHGFADLSEAKDIKLDDFVSIADTRMYEEKKIIKEQEKLNNIMYKK